MIDQAQRLLLVSPFPTATFASRASSAIEITRMVTGLVTVNDNRTIARARPSSRGLGYEKLKGSKAVS